MIITTKNEALTAVAQNGMALRFVPDKLRDAELCRIAVEKCGWMLKYVPEELKDAELCCVAVTQVDRALQYVPKRLKAQMKTLLEAKVDSILARDNYGI